MQACVAVGKQAEDAEFYSVVALCDGVNEQWDKSLLDDVVYIAYALACVQQSHYVVYREGGYFALQGSFLQAVALCVDICPEGA